MVDSFQCPACEIWKIVEGAEKSHEHQVFCKDCMAYLIGYIKFQKELKQDYENYKKGILKIE